MRSGAEDPHLVDVELVEGDLLLGVDGVAPATWTGGPTPAVGRRHVRAWAAAATLAAVALVAAVVNQAEARRDENRLAALADLPGFLDPLTEPLAEAWRARAGRPVARTDVAVLAVDEAGTLRALDIVTGVPAWEQPGVRGEACVPVGRRGDTGPDLPLVAEVVCVPRPGLGVPGVTVVTVLDAVTGETVRTAPAAGVLFADVADGLVLLTGPEPDGALGVRAWDPSTGDTRWAFRSAPRLVEALRAAGGGRYDVRDGRLSIGNRDAGFTVDLSTGRPVDAAEGTGGVQDGVALPDGGEVRWTYDRFGRPKDVQVIARDGDVRFGAPGVPWLAPVSDGSTDDVLVIRRTADQHLLGLDARTGRVRWDLPNVPWLGASVHVGGVAVGLGPSSAVALDLGTGLRLWDHDVARLRGPWEALTDGRVVLLPEEGPSGGLWLAARRLHTGDVAWEVSLPAGLERLQTAGGRTLLAVTQDGFVAFR